jgi:hypothetical protein
MQQMFFLEAKAAASDRTGLALGAVGPNTSSSTWETFAMPIHAQIACIGGNGLFALFFAFAAAGLFGEGQLGPAFLLFRHYLSAEAAIERELHIEQLREEIDKLKANNQPQA